MASPLKLTAKEIRALDLICAGMLIRVAGPKLGVTGCAIHCRIVKARRRNRLKTIYQLIHEYTKRGGEVVTLPKGGRPQRHRKKEKVQ